MPFERGARKPAGSGRKKGTPNRITQDVSERLAELGCDPIEGMARIAANQKNPPELRGRMYAELAQYVYPKRKAIEHSGRNGSPVELAIDARELLLSRIESIAARQGTSEGSGS